MRNLDIWFLFFLCISTSFSHSNFMESMSGGPSINSVETTGDILQVALPIAALSATYFLDDKDGRKQFWKSYISSISLTYLLKYTVDKTRPNGDCCESFPSGHTTAAFSGGMFIQRKYGIKYGIPSLVLASFVGYSRVYANKHYWEDVIVGASIGVLGNMVFTKKYKNMRVSFLKNREDLNLSIGVTL